MRGPPWRTRIPADVVGSGSTSNLINPSGDLRRCAICNTARSRKPTTSSCRGPRSPPPPTWGKAGESRKLDRRARRCASPPQRGGARQLRCGGAVRVSGLAVDESGTIRRSQVHRRSPLRAGQGRARDPVWPIITPRGGESAIIRFAPNVLDEVRRGPFSRLDGWEILERKGAKLWDDFSFSPAPNALKTKALEPRPWDDFADALNRCYGRRLNQSACPMLPLSIFIIAQRRGRPHRRHDPGRARPDGRSRRGRFGLDGRHAGRRRALGARVIYNPWPGYGPQKRFAEEQCRHTWLLNLDADEVVPPDAQPRRSGRCSRTASRLVEPTGSASPRSFPGEDAPHRWAYTLWPVRLYRKDRGRYSSSLVHDRVELAPGARSGGSRA